MDEIELKVPKLVPDNTDVEEGRAISVQDLIDECREAYERMGDGNSHKRLILRCAFAMHQLVQRLDAYENPRRIQ